MPQQSVVFTVYGTDEPLELTDFTAFVAGYTGRDETAVQEHIDELAAIGIAPPPSVPMFYPVEPSSITTHRTVTVSGAKTSGEIEPLYIRTRGRYYLGIASDHTDRDLEADDIAASKRACPKPVGSTVVSVDDINQLDLDDVHVGSYVDGRLYQDGYLNALRPPSNVINLLLENTAIGDGDFVCLGGTVPIIGGDFKYGSEWRLDLELPDRTTLQHSYSTMEGN